MEFLPFTDEVIYIMLIIVSTAKGLKVKQSV